MADYVYLNVNPDNLKVSDCVTRAITLSTKIPYKKVRKMLFHTAKLLGCEKLCVMCYKFLIEDVLKCRRVNCDGMYPDDFANINKTGTYLLRMNGHICTCIDGSIYDIFDSRFYNFITDAWRVD